MRNVADKLYRKSKHILVSITFFVFKNRALYEMWKIVQSQTGHR
jgi:hypothetical protein